MKSIWVVTVKSPDGISRSSTLRSGGLVCRSMRSAPSLILVSRVSQARETLPFAFIWLSSQAPKPGAASGR